MKTKKFDLEKALKGEKVITRSGNEAKDLHYFKNAASGQQRLSGLIYDEVQSWYDDGKWLIEGDSESSLDLFMVSETKSVWVNVYEGNGHLWIGQGHKTKEEALKVALNEECYIKTIEITNTHE